MLAEATRQALEIRGTVVLEAPEEPRRWCAVCASVQGDLEVRVGEPSRGWRAWKPSAGEGGWRISALARNRRGSAHVECGLPGEPVSWNFVTEGALLVEVAAPSRLPEGEYELGRFPLSDQGAVDAGRQLSERLARDLGHSGEVPLFISIVEDWTASDE
jgi:hypothetical protein